MGMILWSNKQQEQKTRSKKYKKKKQIYKYSLQSTIQTFTRSYAIHRVFFFALPLKQPPCACLFYYPFLWTVN